MRYALMYPREMSGSGRRQSDWAGGLEGQGRAVCRPVDQLYERELKTSFDSIKKYQQATYYARRMEARNTIAG